MAPHVPIRPALALIAMVAWGLLASLAQADEPATVPAAGARLRAGDPAGAAEILERVVAAEPDNARAWQLLGFAYHSAGDYARAIPAHEKAAGFEATASAGMYNLACALALTGRRDEAFTWLFRLRERGDANLADIGFDPDLASLADDPRFAGLYPSPAAYADPFVEPVRVLGVWDGEAMGDQFGWIARNIGDVDGDGVNDFTTSAPDHAAGGRGAGRVYVYSGGSGALLWTRDGAAGAQLGLGIEAAGDVNADGVPDVIAGAPGVDLAFVYSGSDGAILRTLRGARPGEAFGRRVADVGDFDGDGHDDVFVGAPDNDLHGEKSGRAAVYSGRTGAVLAEFFGGKPGERLGSALSGASGPDGRVLVIGAPGGGPSGHGRVSVHLGRASRLGFTIDADETGAQMGGMFVSVVGDLDADGVADIYASDWANAAGGPTTGRIVVHSGRDGSRLLTLTGEHAGDGFGIGPADAGDVDGDGRDDLVVGAWRSSGGAPIGGKVYVYSGASGTLMRTITDKVPGDTFGFDATGMGDVDGDGIPDLLLTSGWSAVHGSRTGRVFLVAGE